MTSARTSIGSSMVTGASSAPRAVRTTAGGIDLLPTAPLTSDHPAAAYVERHGTGVANIGFGDVTYTFVQRPEGSAAYDAHGLVAVPGIARSGTGLREVEGFSEARFWCSACSWPGS